MKKACKGGGTKSSNSSKQGKFPRKYRRHQEGLVSKYDYKDTLVFGYTDWQSDAIYPYQPEHDGETYSFSEDFEYAYYNYNHHTFAELRRVGYYTNYIDFGNSLEIPMPLSSLSEPITLESIAQPDFVEWVRWLKGDSTICFPEEKMTPRWTWQEAKLLSHVVDGKLFNPYGCSDELLLHLAFSPLWKSSPCDLSEDEAQGRSVLLRHLYGDFEVPAFLFNQENKGSNSGLPLLVYVTMAKGYSIASILKLTSDYKDYSKRITKCLWEISADTSPDVGISTAYFTSFGITLEIALELSRCNKVRGLEKEILQWFNKNSDHLQTNDVELLVNYMRHRCDESRGQTVSFNAGHGRMLREAREYEESIQRLRRRRQREAERRQRERQRQWTEEEKRRRELWEKERARERAKPFKDDELGFKIGELGCQIVFKQLLNEDELIEEGEQMHHCVGMYGPRCHSGICSIISMQVDGEPTLTIEVSRESKTIAQVRGKRNRFATDEEQYYVRRWAEEKSLVYET